MTAEDQWATAFHESGHALAYIHLGWRFKSVAIYDDNPAQDGSLSSPNGPDYRQRYPWFYAAACLAGIVAEGRYTGSDWAELVFGGGRIDVKMAEDALARLRHAPPVAGITRYTLEMVEEEWPRIEVVAQYLVQRRQLTYDEVVSLCRPRTWRMPPFPCLSEPTERAA